MKKITLRILAASTTAACICVFVAATIVSVQLAGSIMLCAMMGQIGENTVIETVDSSDGKYTAQLIDRDEGALSGATIIEVTDNSKQINLIFFEIGRKPKQVYYGAWGESMHMNIHWKDNNTLVADGKEYKIQE